MKAQRESSYTYTLPLTSVLDGRGGQCHAAAALSQEIDPVPIVWEAGWPPKLVWTGALPSGFDLRTVQSLSSREGEENHIISKCTSL